MNRPDRCPRVAVLALAWIVLCLPSELCPAQGGGLPPPMEFQELTRKGGTPPLRVERGPANVHTHSPAPSRQAPPAFFAP